MGLDVIVEDFLIQILSGLIVASIIGAATSFAYLIRCVHKQARDIALMKKANAIVLNLLVKETKRLHGDDSAISDLEKIYKELIHSD